MKVYMLAAVLTVLTAGAMAQERVPSIPPLSSSSGVKPDERILDIVKSKNVDYRVFSDLKDRKLFSILYGWPSGRRQTAIVASFTEPLNPKDQASPYVRRITSYAYSGPEAPPADMLVKLMEQSHDVLLGAWEIYRQPNGNYAVLFNMKVDADTSQYTVMWIREQVTVIADRAEMEFENRISPKTSVIYYATIVNIRISYVRS
jgi:hypothetical protein